ncbi:antitoxin Xre/MbcA/ParS toxin-binding domain-containing protein [Lysobacter humi (ex Lee et al. 2017)]
MVQRAEPDPPRVPAGASGGGQHAAQQWLRGPNIGLGRPPIERLLEAGGASALLDYTHAFYR